MDLAELTQIYDFTGRSVVVTGGTGILGSVMVKALVGCGANVTVLARNRHKAAALLSADQSTEVSRVRSKVTRSNWTSFNKLPKLSLRSLDE